MFVQIDLYHTYESKHILDGNNQEMMTLEFRQVGRHDAVDGDMETVCGEALCQQQEEQIAAQNWARRDNGITDY